MKSTESTLNEGQENSSPCKNISILCRFLPENILFSQELNVLESMKRKGGVRPSHPYSAGKEKK